MTAAPTVLAASQAIADVLTGPRRSAVVVHRSAPAAYLRLDDARIISFETADGIGLPISATVETLNGVEVGASVEVGGRAPARWWSSEAAPLVPAPEGARRLADRLARLPTSDDPHMAAVAVIDPLEDPAGLVGLGPGLTPAGDDFLAGTLVTLHALDLGASGAALVDRIDATRTTPISGALLAEAARGRAARPLLGLLRSLAGSGEVGPALDGLLAVGATSGRWLAEGVSRALRQL